MTAVEYPDDLRYTTDHEWVKDVGDGVVRIGITAFAQDALGDVVYVTLPQVGEQVAAGDAVGEVESTKSVSDIYAPLAGEVSAANEGLDQTPEAINTDPYGEGWILELKLSDPASVEALLDAEGYAAQID